MNLVIKGRSVGKSTDLANGHVNIKKVTITEEEAAEARIDFIKKFPALAPLMYSINPPFEPATTGEWLGIMRMEVERAIADNFNPELREWTAKT